MLYFAQVIKVCVGWCDRECEMESISSIVNREVDTKWFVFVTTEIH